MSLATDILRFRAQKNLSQQALAEILGVDKQTVSRWERGTSPRGANLVAIYALLNETATTGIIDQGLASSLEKLDPIQRSAVRGFIEGLLASGSLDSALIAAKAVEALERSRRSSEGQEAAQKHRLGA